MTEKLGGAQVRFDVTLELGSSISLDPASYISGPEWTMEHTAVDPSGVNFLRTGDYVLKITNPFAEYSCAVHVRDTIPPKLVTDDTSREVLAAGEEYDTDIIGARATDLSGLTFIRYLYEDREVESLCFEEAGEHKVTVTATDANANRSEKTVEFFVDTPPVFYGLHDQYVVTGADGSDLDPVFAYDEVDGGLSFDIKTDASKVDFDKVGAYRIEYEVRDGYGLMSTASATVHVVATAWQARAHYNDASLTKEELAMITEEDYFAGKINDKEDRQWVIDNCRPSLVNLYVERDDGSVSSGSGFIYRITEDYVYIVSVYHVTGFLEGERVRVTFFDGEHEEMTMHSIRQSAGNEASLFRIPTEDVPYHTLVRLREAAEDKDIYTKVKSGTSLVEYCSNWRGGEIEEIVKDVKVISFTLSPIQRKYVDNDEYYAVTRRSVNGMSGTAVFDLRGALAGICSKTMYPLSNEDVEFQDGCDFVLMIDKLDTLLDREEELEKMEKRR